MCKRFAITIVVVLSWFVPAEFARAAPVLAIAPVRSADFPASITGPIAAKLVELARDSADFSVSDQGDIQTVLRMQKQGVSAIMADPVALGKMVAARKVLTADLQRGGGECSLNLKITEVETGIVEAAKLDVGACSLSDLLGRTEALWKRLVAGRLHIETVPPGLVISVDGVAAGSAPLDLDVPAGLRLVAVASPGYSPASTNITVGYQSRHAVRLTSKTMSLGALSVSGSPIGAVVYEGAERLGVIPFEVRMPPGNHRLEVETDAGRYSRPVTVSAGVRTALRVDLPFAALQKFEKDFIAGNTLARSGLHADAAAKHDAALTFGIAAKAFIPTDTSAEFYAALAYVQGARALEQAWVKKDDAELSRDIGPYCVALNEAASKFEEARGLVPPVPKLRLAMLTLARTRSPLTLGACSPKARFREQVSALEWPLAATAGEMSRVVNTNRSALSVLRVVKELDESQRKWLRAEEAMSLAYEKFGSLGQAQAQMLKEPSATLPRLCALRKEVMGYATTAERGYEAASNTLPKTGRLALVRSMRSRAEAAGSFCDPEEGSPP